MHNTYCVCTCICAGERRSLTTDDHFAASAILPPLCKFSQYVQHNAMYAGNVLFSLSYCKKGNVNRLLNLFRGKSTWVMMMITAIGTRIVGLSFFSLSLSFILLEIGIDFSFYGFQS